VHVPTTVPECDLILGIGRADLFQHQFEFILGSNRVEINQLASKGGMLVRNDPAKAPGQCLRYGNAGDRIARGLCPSRNNDQLRRYGQFGEELHHIKKADDSDIDCRV
jgi:hypothetical protein